MDFDILKKFHVWGSKEILLTGGAPHEADGSVNKN